MVLQAAVFDVCYATHNDGMECSDSFSQHKDLPADKWVFSFSVKAKDKQLC